MKENNLRQFKDSSDDNKGSTLITVIVAIAFVTILVSIILGTTVVNVRMKGIDRRTKDDFYYAEKALNDIYTGIGLELAQTAADEYENTFKKIGFDDEGLGGDFNMAEVAEKDFRKNFVIAAYKKIDKLDGTPNDNDNKVSKSSLEAYITGQSPPGELPKTEVVDDVNIVYRKKDGSGESTSYSSDVDSVVLKDVTVMRTDASGYMSVISTDFIINIPTVDFLGTNVDVSDYGIIAGKGLYILGDTTINGNVYAGIHPTPIPSVDAYYQEKNDEKTHKGVSGGINVKGAKATFNGNYIISKGDINLAWVNGKNTELKVLTPGAGEDVNLSNLWYTSLRTIKGNNPEGITDKFNIDINANVFALNDLALNADNSTVKIKGNYYGYNDKTLKSILGFSESEFEDTNVSRRDDAVNSAIIINGSNASLDMSEISNLVLMGKAYIDFTSDTSTTNWENGQVVPTAEGVALKTNQQLYLVPPDFLDGPNPVEGGTGVFTVSIPNTDLQKWFGYKFLDTSDVPKSIHSTYKVKLNSAEGGSNVYYDYLVFSKDPIVKDDGTVVGYSWEPKEITKSEYDAKDETDDDTVYIVTKNSPSTYKYYKYIKVNKQIGTGGSISSKAMFFLKIMTSPTEYEYAAKKADIEKTEYIKMKENESGIIQPSAYRLHDRVNLSMGYDYFNLQQCVVGDNDAPGKAHYYAKNAVVNYKKDGSEFQSNVLDNTEGMLRYAGYPQNLYNRYKWLCTYLDGKEDTLLEVDPGEPKDEWKVDSTAPFSKFVKMSNIASMTIEGSKNAAGSDAKNPIKSTTYGVVVATTGNLTLSNTDGEEFKGVAIVDGNIIVPSSVKKVNGLLMATGTITIEGNTEINYDRGLIQSRIEKELNIVKNMPRDTSDSYPFPGGKKGYRQYYLISYLSKLNGSDLLYNVEPGSKIKRERIEADYNDFMHYENWQKGENDATPTPTPTPTP